MRVDAAGSAAGDVASMMRAGQRASSPDLAATKPGCKAPDTSCPDCAQSAPHSDPRSCGGPDAVPDDAMANGHIRSTWLQQKKARGRLNSHPAPGGGASASRQARAVVPRLPSWGPRSPPWAGPPRTPHPVHPAPGDDRGGARCGTRINVPQSWQSSASRATCGILFQLPHTYSTCRHCPCSCHPCAFWYK